ncbi:diacylglycerol kinase eta [Galendromus occidentalis]|uniref:Diacylglycerol kinase n=1 Tax=Galendromus occidentalis TaxID=34638 RepID=A0AAJ7SG24_9ACAR|nr:diacylglycerol kinase eta [Galendromus occidentalis]
MIRFCRVDEKSVLYLRSPRDAPEILLGQFPFCTYVFELLVILTMLLHFLSGYISFKGQRWKRRYFRLKPRRLYYAKDSKSVIYEEIALVGVSVAECSTRHGASGLSLNSSPHAFTLITPLRQLVLCADSRKHMDEWMSALKGVSNKDFIEGPPQNAPPPTPPQGACIDDNAAEQQPRLPQLEDLKLQGQHSWYVASHARPTYCNVCREALSGVTFHGLSCEVCKFRAHKRCAAESPNNCKWTTLASVGSEVLEDDEGNPTMPHQWVEGNLPVSSKCWACEKACGSVLRLLDWRCLWCRATVHTACKPIFSVQCPLGVCWVSVVPPICLQPASAGSSAGLDWWRGCKPPGCSPLLVFVNSKSGDNQGVKFLRRLRQLLNPAQVFDLMAPNGGPLLGLQLFSSFQTFRILVCGGDGSVSWVLSEIDRLRLHKQCQIGVLPLGTGNDLARVLGWGSVCDDDNQLPQLLEKYERATTKLLDRWSILTYEGPLPMPRKLSQPYPTEARGKSEPAPDAAVGKRDQSMSRLEDSVVDHLSKILESDQHCVVISSARILCETVRDFILKVQSKTESKEIEDKCSVLNEKLDSLLKSLHEEEQAETSLVATSGGSPNHKPEQAEQQRIREPSPSGRQNPTQPQQQQLLQPQQYNSSNNSAVVHHPRNKSAILQRGALMCRANSLKKALRQIIEHTERAVDEQNALPGDWRVPNSCASRRESSSNSSSANKSPKHRGYSSPCEEASSTSVGTSGRPHSLPILETTPDSPQTTYASGSENMTNADFAEKSLLQLNSPTASRRISSGSTLKHIGNFGLQLAVTPSFGGGSSSPGGLLSGGARSPEDVDRRMFPIINPLASLPAWPNLAGESSLVGKALLANADALCAAASPLMDIDDMNMDCFQEKCVMNNYFGIGLDAKIALEFHNKREEHPEKCRSRTKNLMWYGVLGGRELLNKTYKNLEQRVHLECDGHRIALPSLQGIVVLNIPSYGGGSNFWGGSKEDDVFFAPAMDDKILEVVAVFGTVQMAASRVINLQHHRIAQCRSVRITITGSEGVPVQVDGEAWLQPPGCVCIQHKNRTQILCRNRQFESSLKSWNEKQRRPSSGELLVVRWDSFFNGSAHSNNRGPLSEEEAQHLSTFIDAASQLVQVIQTMSESNPVVDNELWLAASQTNSLIERFFPNGLQPYAGGSSRDNEPPQRQHFGELISSAKQLQLETKIFIGEKIDNVSRMTSEQEDALVSASVRLESELKRCLTIRTLALFYDVEQLSVADESALCSSRNTSKCRLPMFRFKLRALKASCLAHSETVPLAKLDRTLEKTLVRSAPVSPERPIPLTSPVVGPVSEWSSREVLHWLEHSLHLSEYREAFVRHDIQGAELVNLERRDLEQLGVAKVGHAKRILRAIHDLIRESSRP